MLGKVLTSELVFHNYGVSICNKIEGTNVCFTELFKRITPKISGYFIFESEVHLKENTTNVIILNSPEWGRWGHEGNGPWNWWYFCNPEGLCLPTGAWINRMYPGLISLTPIYRLRQRMGVAWRLPSTSWGQRSVSASSITRSLTTRGQVCLDFQTFVSCNNLLGQNGKSVTSASWPRWAPASSSAWTRTRWRAACGSRPCPSPRGASPSRSCPMASRPQRLSSSHLYPAGMIGMFKSCFPGGGVTSRAPGGQPQSPGWRPTPRPSAWLGPWRSSTSRVWWADMCSSAANLVIVRSDEWDLHRGEAGGGRLEGDQWLRLAARGGDGGQERGAVHPGDAGAGRHHGECSHNLVYYSIDDLHEYVIYTFIQAHLHYDSATSPFKGSFEQRDYLDKLEHRAR